MNIEFQAIPIFRILHYDQAMAFYVNFLGLSIDWEHRFGESAPVYLQVSGHGLVLHLSENKRYETGTIIFVATTGIEDFHSELKNKQTGFVPEIEYTPWNTKQLELKDPFGNLIRFNENVL